MWRKTVLKRLAKYLPSSSDLDGIIEYDNAEFGINLDSEQQGQPEAANKAPAKKKGTRASSAILKDKPKPAAAAKEDIEDGVILDDAPENTGEDEQNVDDLI